MQNTVFSEDREDSGWPNSYGCWLLTTGLTPVLDVGSDTNTHKSSDFQTPICPGFPPPIVRIMVFNTTFNNISVIAGVEIFFHT